ncbi:MAG: histidinol-phosphate transaminase [Pseudomonadota bacterium]
MSHPPIKASDAVNNLVPYQSARALNAFNPSNTYIDANEMPDAPDLSSVDLGSIHHYADEQCRQLTDAYAKFANLSPECVIAGRGIDEIIDLAVRAYCEPHKDEILVMPPTYDVYRFTADTHRCGVVEIPLTLEGQMDLDAIANLDPLPRVIFVCRPNNPLGSIHAAEDVSRLLELAAGKSLVALDEAYIEFCEEESLAPLIAEHSNLIVMRTLSKAFGLAGLHVGFGLAQPGIIETLNKLINPYPIPDPCARLAIEALSPAGVDRMRASVDRVVQTRRAFENALRVSPKCTKIMPSRTNFVLAAFEDAGQIMTELSERNIIARRFLKPATGDQWIRFSIGAPEVMDEIAAALA